MFTLELLPARHGDALWIEYGQRAAPHRILIDGGPRSRTTWDRLRALVSDRVETRPSGTTDFELVVVSHIDADHISGILKLFETLPIDLSPRDVWFNGWQHLPSDALGAKQGEALSAAIVGRGLAWNDGFASGAVMVPDAGPLPVVDLPGGMRLTLLGPTRTALADLRPVWQREVTKAGLVPGAGAEPAASQPDRLGDAALDPDELANEPFSPDGSAANGASISLLAEFDGRSLLLTGDAHAADLATGLGRLAVERGVDRVPVTAFKLPHHGSKYNLNRDVLDLVECDRFIFSTNGDIFGHPDPVAVSRIITSVPECTLEFNYRSETTERWNSSRLRRRYRYEPVYPEGTAPGLRIDI